MRCVFKNANLIDGSGAPGAQGDLLVEGDLIADIGVFPTPADAEVIDCTGLTLTPGFVDAHSHGDLQTLEGRREKVAQGVTTEVVGNCGFSAYPAADSKAELHEFANPILFGGDQWGWASAREYLAEAERRPSSTNVVSLVGHGTLRIAVAGNRQGQLREDDVRRMETLLSAAFEQGATGFSTGLMYAPGSSAPQDELERLCRVTAHHGRVYATHMRSYTDALVESVAEQIELSRRTGCRLQISHFQAVGPANWPAQERALELIESARRDGIDVEFDCYPYTRGSTVATQLLPQWALGQGIAGMLVALGDPGTRQKIATETEAALAQGWHGILISSVDSADDRGVVGRSLAEIGELRAKAPVEALFDLLTEYRGRVNMLEINQSEDNLRQTLTHPLSTVISDGFYVSGKPHPRLYGTFPHWLGHYCRDLRWISLEEAVAKITSRPAERFQLKGRGLLRKGYLADITVFDAERIASPATYENPCVGPEGIAGVYRSGYRRN
jgi:N-acyl-D-amino-acid deacylase